MNTERVNDLHVLVVDGNTVNTMLLTRTLQLFHFKTQICASKDTVKCLRKNNFDIAFIYHKLPDVNGTEVMEAIRKLKKNKKNIIVYILTDFATEEIKEQYRVFGANKVMEQPLKMETFLMDVMQYFPQLNLLIPVELKKHNCRESYEWCKIKTAFYAVKEINLEAGVKNSMGNHVLFIQIIRSALKDLSAFVDIINRQDKISIDEIKKGLHNLKGVLPYIGADNLVEDTRKLEADLKQGYFMAAVDRMKDYMQRLCALQEELQKALENYNILMELIRDDMTAETLNEEMQADRLDMYEHCIRKAIYYINRYEYDHILQELDRLTRIDAGHLETYRMVMERIKEFDYEEALKLLIGLEYWKK